MTSTKDTSANISDFIGFISNNTNVVSSPSIDVSNVSNFIDSASINIPYITQGNIDSIVEPAIEIDMESIIHHLNHRDPDTENRISIDAKNYLLIYHLVVGRSDLERIYEGYGKIRKNYPIISYNGTKTFVYLSYDTFRTQSKPETFAYGIYRADVFTIKVGGHKNVEEWVKVIDPAYAKSEKARPLNMAEKVGKYKTKKEALASCIKPSDVMGTMQCFDILQEAKKNLDPWIMNYKPWGWQLSLMKLVWEKPEERDILWFYNPKPRLGKSTIGYYLMANLPEYFYVMTDPSFGKDMATVKQSALNAGWNNHCLIINLSMTYDGLEWLYSVLELMKDPVITSTKYRGNTMITGPGHVVVFANFAPNPFSKEGKQLIDPKRIKSYLIQEIGDDPNPPRSRGTVVGLPELESGNEDIIAKQLAVCQSGEQLRRKGKPSDIDTVALLTSPPIVVNEEEKEENKSLPHGHILDRVAADIKNPPEPIKLKEIPGWRDPHRDGLFWYPYLNKDDSAMVAKGITIPANKILMKCNKISESNIVISKEYKVRNFKGMAIDMRGFRVFKDVFNLYNKHYHNMPDDERTYYEVITVNRDQKLYFDIDMPSDTFTREQAYELIYQLKIGIMNVESCIEPEDIMVFNSHGSKKHSFHVVIDRYHVTNCNENMAFCIMASEYVSPELRVAIDLCVYKKSQQFRLYGSQKYGSGRVKKLDDCSEWIPDEDDEEGENAEGINFLKRLRASLITHVGTCKIMKVASEPTKEFAGQPRDYSEDEMKQINDALELRYPGVFSYNCENKSSLGYKRNKSAHCNICKRVHDNQNVTLSINKTGDIRLFCYQSNKDLPNRFEIIGSVTK